MHLSYKKRHHGSSVGLMARVIVTLATISGTWAHAASAQTVLSFTSEPGDYIGGGQTLTLTPGDSDFRSMTGQDQRTIGVSVFPFSGGF